MLKGLLADEIKLVVKRNLVAGRAFSEMLADSVLRARALAFTHC